MADRISRRSFLKIAALASSAVAVEACKPQEGTKLIPYLVPDQNVIPGVPAFYRTACSECSAGCGVVAKVREGRVIKLEGNPDNPINAGALCARGQAALQGLYNPDRLPAPRHKDHSGSLKDIDWDNALRIISSSCQKAAGKGSNRIAFLGRPRGPSFDSVLREFLRTFNSNRLNYYEPLSETAAIDATRACFDRSDLPLFRIDQARVLISFGADFLDTWRSPVEFSRQYAAFRTPRHSDSTGESIGLSYYIGPRFSLTAAKTDYYFQSRPGTEALVALALLRSMNDQGLIKDAHLQARLKQFVAPFTLEAVQHQAGIPAKHIQAIATEFARAPSAIALAGTDDVSTHIATNLINASTGNLNKTVLFYEPPVDKMTVPNQHSLTSLLQSMRSGEVDVLIIEGVNPAFSLSSKLEFATAVKHVPVVIWCGGVPDETSRFAHLLIPAHHTLEDWTDFEARPGVRTLGQPVMQPVFDSRAFGDILLDSARLSGTNLQWQDMGSAVEAQWTAAAADGRSPEQVWDFARRTGGIFVQTATKPVTLLDSVLDKPPRISSPGSELTLLAYPHPFLYDGRGANKPWLQENPDPVSQLVWDSWMQIHPDTAKALGINDDDVVTLRSTYGQIDVSAKVDRGVHPECVAVPLGQGHAFFGRYATGRGGNPWLILPPDSLQIPVTVHLTGKKHKLVSPLFTSDMMHRPIVETISTEDFDKGRRPPPDEPPPAKPYELWPEHVYQKHHWGMTIDLNACMGCGACVTACYAENNLNVVGREGVRMGRIMSWLRLERYFPEDTDAPQILIMPMLCQQCDHAPCEPVCPVYASSHTEEGLNAQVYNRCVGTRYCENNCPYKVRRFNWFKPEFAQPFDLQLNPDVTVRGEGVMEKCTFCVQRIRAVEIAAKIEERLVRDGEIIPACAQTCPTSAISFGDTLDSHGAMMRMRKDNQLRTYRALEDLNTQPSIVYLRTIYRRRGG